MRVLALDACLGAVSAAAGTLAPEGWVDVAVAFELRSAGHAEALIPMLADVMRRANLAFADLDRVVVTNGPGGFTGVRATVAAARALALSTPAKLVAISTLDALAAEARARVTVKRPLAIAIDARREAVFFALYREGRDEAAPSLVTVADAAAQAHAAGAAVAGSGAPLLARALAEQGFELETLLPDLQPRAETFGLFAALRAPTGSVRPLYLRPADAKAQTSFVLPRAPS